MKSKPPPVPQRNARFGQPHRLPDCVASALPGEPLDPTKWHQVLEALLDKHNWAHGTRAKSVSFKTMKERKGFLFRFFRKLRQDPETRFFIDPRSLRHRHVQHSVHRWIEAGLTVGSIKNYLSHLRVFSGWIGKRGMVLNIEKYVDAPSLLKRTNVATSDRSWSAHDVDAAEVLARVNAIDRFVGAQLFMIQAFGLRVKEAITCRPHLAVVDDRLFLADASDLGTNLEVKRGTKGGRVRYVAIDSDLKQQALKHAKETARLNEDSLSDPRLSLKEAYGRFYYVLGKAGLTRAALGVTAHGLRHQYAHDKYEQLTGVPAPVRGGPRGLDDHEARIAVARDLGHARKQISSAYLGSSAAGASEEKGASDVN